MPERTAADSEPEMAAPQIERRRAAAMPCARGLLARLSSALRHGDGERALAELARHECELWF